MAGKWEIWTLITVWPFLTDLFQKSIYLLREWAFCIISDTEKRHHENVLKQPLSESLGRTMATHQTKYWLWHILQTQQSRQTPSNSEWSKSSCWIIHLTTERPGGVTKLGHDHGAEGYVVVSDACIQQRGKPLLTNTHTSCIVSMWHNRSVLVSLKLVSGCRCSFHEFSRKRLYIKTDFIHQDDFILLFSLFLFLCGFLFKREVFLGKLTRISIQFSWKDYLRVLSCRGKNVNEKYHRLSGVRRN